MKAVILAGGYGTRHQRGERRPPEADGRDRREADPLAHHEDLRRARDRRVRDRGGYKGYLIKEYFANYFLHATDITVDLRRPRDQRRSRRGRAVDGDDRRHRRRHHDRRPAEARPRAYRRRDVLPHVRRLRRATSTWPRRSSSTATRVPRDAHGDPAAGPLRRAQPRGRPRRRRSSRSRQATAAGSTAGSSSSSPGSSTTSKATRRSGSASRSSGSPDEASSPRTSTRATGRTMDTLRDKAVLEELWASGEAPWKIW